MNGMGRCIDCEHWDPVVEAKYGDMPGSGTCKAARQIWDVTESNTDGTRKLLPEHAGLLCVVSDGSQYAAELITMSDFGCVMHKPLLRVDP